MTKVNVRWMLVMPLVAAVLLATGGCGSTPRVDLAAEEKAVRAAETEFAKAAAAKDLDKVVAFYAEDAALLPPGEAVATSKTAIRASWTQLLALPDLEMTWTPAKIEVATSGDLAYDYGAYAMSHKNAAGKVVNDRGKYATVWRKGATSGWKVVVDTNNSDLPAPKPAAKKASPKKAAPKAKQSKR
jgi:uncharacterized protein (TIGR02246 family)